uniref:hypothetical protein n=1 Tax=Thiolapillus sp. TaxID=2017437 RepID=UPI0025E09F93
PSQNLHPNNSPDLFKSDTGDDRLPQNPVGGGVGKYDKVELRIGTKNNRNYSKRKSMIYRDLILM